MVHSILQNNQKRHANPEKTLCTNKELHELCVALKMATKCLQFQAENAYRTPKRRFFSCMALQAFLLQITFYIFNKLPEYIFHKIFTYLFENNATRRIDVDNRTIS